MQKPFHYQRQERRFSLTFALLLNAARTWSPWPRMLLEVFIRKNPGPRYYSVASMIAVVVLLIFFPLTRLDLLVFPRSEYDTVTEYFFGPPTRGPIWFMARYTTWYLFIGVFVYFCYLRIQEQRRSAAAFNGDQYSLSPGEIHESFFYLDSDSSFFFSSWSSTRRIEVLWEPLICAGVGLGLWTLGQYIGGVLTTCSIIYGVSYFIFYRAGDHYVMDRQDEKLINAEYVETFTDKSPIGRAVNEPVRDDDDDEVVRAK